MKYLEDVNLLKATVFFDGKESYTFNFNKPKRAPNPYVFRGDHDSFVKFLMGIKAKDEKTYPNSVRGERYADIATEIEDGTDKNIYVWEHDFMRYIKKVNETEDTVQRDFNVLQQKVDSLFKWNKLINYRIALSLSYNPDPDWGYVLGFSIASLGFIPVGRLEEFSLATEKALLLIKAFCKAHPEVNVK